LPERLGNNDVAVDGTSLSRHLRKKARGSCAAVERHAAGSKPCRGRDCDADKA